MKLLGIEFKNTENITRALTHPSASKDNYQRLEFLGDSLLDFFVAEFLYNKVDKQEGVLSVMRAHYVSEDHLAERFDHFDLAPYVILGKSMQNKITKSGKADIIEAIVGSFYLEFGFNKTRKFIIDLLDLNSFSDFEDDNYKTQLQELIQANFKCAIRYETVKEGNEFCATFYMDDDPIATGYGSKRMTAEQNAAYVAIQKLFKDEE